MTDDRGAATARVDVPQAPRGFHVQSGQPNSRRHADLERRGQPAASVPAGSDEDGLLLRFSWPACWTARPASSRSRPSSNSETGLTGGRAFRGSNHRVCRCFGHRAGRRLVSAVLSPQLLAYLLLSTLTGILELAQLTRETSLLIRHRPLLFADRELLVDLRSP